MLYSVEYSIPANTSKESPARIRLPATWGVATQVWVRWRFGSGNLCGARIFYQESQLWPRSLGEWLPSANESMEWSEWFEISDFPTEFEVECYNLDDTFAHTLFVAVNVQRPSVSSDLRAFLEFVSKGG